jgi:hypothetical protein
MRSRLRLLVASVLAALTAGPAPVSDWFPEGDYGPIALIGTTGAVVAHVNCHISDRKPETTMSYVVSAVVGPASPAIPAGGTEEVTIPGPKGRTVRVRARSEYTGRFGGKPGGATVIEVRPGLASFQPVSIPWGRIGAGGGAALVLVCKVIDCPKITGAWWDARRWAKRRPIGFRLALPVVLIAALAYAASRRVRHATSRFSR